MKKNKMTAREKALTALWACLFSACVTVGRHITFAGNVKLKITENFMTPLTVRDIPVFALVAALSAGLLTLAQRYVKGSAAKALDTDIKRMLKTGACFAGALLFAWLPYMLAVAPGNIYGDSLESIHQMLLHGHPTYNHHPMFYTLLVGVFLKIGTFFFQSANIGVLIYSLFQTCVMLFCIVCVLLLLVYRGVPKVLVGAAAAYYMFMPYFPNYAMTMWKDPMFSCMLLLLTLLLYMLYVRRTAGKWWFICYFVVGVGTMMMRNNGIYVFAASSALAAFIMRKHAKRLLVSAAAALVVFVSLSSLATAVWNIHGDFVENLGIPLQQLGYTINNGGEFSEEDREYLYTLMPEQVWNYAYRPCLVDTIKWNPQFNTEFLLETKGQFFKVWLHGLVNNFGDYVDSYLLATHGFFAPFMQNLYGYMDVQMNDNPYGIGFMDLFEKLTGYSLMPILVNYPIIMGSGTLLWLCLAGMALLCMRRWDGAVVYLPAMLNWATVMVATPVAYSLRYVYIFAIGLPLFMALPLIEANRARKNGESLDRNA